MKTANLRTLAAAIVLSSAALWSFSSTQAVHASVAGSGAQEQPPAQATPAPGAGMEEQMRAVCPMAMPGVQVEVTDTEGGVALTFTTEEGNVDELRQRVQHMARMYEMHAGRGSMMWRRMGPGHQGKGRGGPGMGHGAGHGPVPAASATVEQIDNGARLVLTPTDPARLDALRAHVRWHQQRMQAGECWMPEPPPSPE